MNIDAKILSKILSKEFNNTSKVTFIPGMQGCSTYKCNTLYKEKQGQKSHDPLNRCIKSLWQKAFCQIHCEAVGDFNSCLSPIDRSSRQKNPHRYPRTKWHHTSNGPNWCLQALSSNNSTIYILFSSPWNFLQNISYLFCTKQILNKYKKIEINPAISLITMH
jgi:hypothetical protein